MTILHQDPDSNKTPPCASGDCPEPGTVYGIYDDGDTQARVNYCSYCAGLLYREFTPLSSTTLNLRALVIAALPLPGEVMTPEAWGRVVDDLLLRGGV